MPKKINYTLTNKELLTIEQAIKNDENLRVRERARIIRLLHRGQKHQEVADLLAISIGQVYWWHQRWRKEGLAGLSDKQRTGRPTIGTEEVRAQLEKLLETEPQELGYAFTVWNAPRLLTYMKEEAGVQMHENTLRNILADMGFVYRRPKHDLTSLQDAQAKERAEEVLDELKKKPALWTKQP
jgi:transposase